MGERTSDKPVRIDQYLVIPYKTGIRNFQSIVTYFLYLAPNIECRHNFKTRIADERAEVVLHEMKTKAGIGEKNFRFYKAKTSNAMKDLNLVGDKICFTPCRLACKKGKSEDEITCLLRHIRNAFAHGNVYLIRKKTGKNAANYMMLEDYDARCNEITARMVLTSKILEDWKAILENEITTGE